MKVQHAYVDEAQEGKSLLNKKSAKRDFALDEPLLLYKTSLSRWGIPVAVVLLHLLLIAWLLSNTRHYRPLNLINPAPQVAVQVTMVEQPDPVPVPIVTPPSPQIAPKILTSNDADRQTTSAAQPTVAPSPVPKVVKDVPKVIPKQPVKKHQIKEIKKVPPKRPLKKPLHKTNVKPQEKQDITKPTQNIADKNAAPASTQQKMLSQPVQAAPKSVASVGCQVPAPDYPPKAKRLGIEGQVLIRVVIGADGSLLRHEIARSSGNEELDDAAMNAVAGTHCQPYIENGTAISVMTIQPITFRLDN